MITLLLRLLLLLWLLNELEDDDDEDTVGDEVSAGKGGVGVDEPLTSDST